MSMKRTFWVCRAVVILAVLACPAVFLLHIGGRPWQPAWLTGPGIRAWLDDPLQPRALAGSVVVMGWLLWSTITAMVVVRVWGRLRRCSMTVVAAHLPGPVQGLTATLLGAAAVTTVAAPAAHAADVAVAAAVGPEQPGHAGAFASVSSVWVMSGGGAAATAAVPRSSDDQVCVVERGDTLYDIAETWLDDGDRWPDIFALNRGTHYRHVGGTFTDPDLIRPGWTLKLPGDADPPDGGYRTPAATVPTPPAATQAPPPETEKDPTPTVPATPGSPSSPTDDGATDTEPPPTAAVPPPGRAAPDARPESRDMSRTGPGWLSAGIAALVVLAAALGLRRPPRELYRRLGNTGRRAWKLDVIARLRLSASRRARHRDLDLAGGHSGSATGALPQGMDGSRDGGMNAAGLGLQGPGAHGAARAQIMSALTGSGGEGRVVVTGRLLGELLDGQIAALPSRTGLLVAADLEHALAAVDEAVLERSRLHDDDLASDDPDSPPKDEPLLLIVADSDMDASSDHGRLAALLAQGAPLQVRGIILGQWAGGPNLAVAADGTTAPLDGTRSAGTVTPGTPMPVLSADDILQGLIRRGDDAPAGDRQPLLPEPRMEKSPDNAATSATAGTDTNSREPVPAADGGNPAVRRADVVLLGDARIAGGGDESMRAKSRELLVYLAARGGSASQEAILDDLLPEAPASKAPYRLHTYVYNLRKVLRAAAGPGTYVEHPARRYALAADAVDIDLWRMQSAVRAAAASTDPADRITALRTAVDAYTGPLAAGYDYEWIEPYREAVARDAIDAALDLADALTADRPDKAIAVLAAAIDQHPQQEPLYQAAMRLHGASGDIGAVKALYRRLVRQLQDLDATPSLDTDALLRSIVSGTDRQSPATGDPS